MDYHSYLAEDFAADESFNAYYLQSNEAAVKFWKEWMSHHPEKLDEIYNAELLLATLYLRLPDEELHAEFALFDHFLGATPSAGNALKRNSSFYNHQKFWVPAFSVLLVVLFGGIFFFLQKPAPNTENTYVTRKTGAGKILIVWLTDGTKVILNANSTLQYPKTFEADKRSVYLSGEAYFEVAKHKTRPFTVTAGETKTTVFGTKFNIYAYPEGKSTEIALIEGHVAVSLDKNPNGIHLEPLQKAVFTKKNHHLNVRSFEPQVATAWQKGNLIFNNAGFDEIALKIKNMYGITLLDSTHAGEWKYTGSFSKTDYHSLLKNVCFARNLTFSQHEHTIILKQKK